VPPPAVSASRVTLAVLMVATVVAGLGGRAVLPAAVGGPAGDVLYAVLLVWVVAFVAPRTTPATAFAIALGAATLVEASHLTPLPATVLDRFPAARYVLGTTFGVADLAWYALGAALAGAVLAVLRRRPATVDEALRHVRARPDHAEPRWVSRIAVPLALAAAVGAAALGAGLSLQAEAEDLSTTIATARAELDASTGKVADDAVRAALDDELATAASVRQGTPILERRPGDAVAAEDRLDAAVSAVHASRRDFATTRATEVRSTLTAPLRRGEQILTATDELARAGQDAGEAARTGLRDAVTSSEELVAATERDRLAQLPLAELEGIADVLATGRDAVATATTALMTAQDAVVCPEDDQRWDPRGGKLADEDLAPIPWAPSHLIRADLLDGLVALDDAFRAEFGEHLPVNSGYRSHADQVAVYRPGNPNPLAAPPGCSNHGLGTAVDISMGPEGFDGARFAWMTAHAEQFGWVHPEWAGPSGRLPEPWHWESVETPQSY
jgi:D-alanyl-D-alanine carboxypeptidase